VASTHVLDRWMYKGGHPNRLARTLNHIWSMLASRGVGPKGLCTLEVRGRRSGRTIAFPVVVADYERERYLVAMLGNRANWVANVRASGGDAVLRHGGIEEVRLEDVAAADRPAILRHYVAVAPGGRAHIGLDSDDALPDFEKIARDVPVFRIASRPSQ
jgi:hypothetical protein